MATERAIGFGSSWVENTPQRGWWRRGVFREAWRYREIAVFLALRDVKLRYRQTFFGAAWAVLQPLLAAGIFAVVFGRFGNLPSEGLPYFAFAYAGLVGWFYVSNAVSGAAQSLTANTALVTKVYFPRVLAPVSAVLPGLLDLAVMLSALAAVLIASDVRPGVSLLLLPIWIAALAVIAFAAGVWLAALNVRYRDVRHALAFALQVWLFASPVVYPSSLIDGAWRAAYHLNPLVGAIDGFRWSALGAPPPTATDLLSAATAAALLVGGLVYFARAERAFGDVI